MIKRDPQQGLMNTGPVGLRRSSLWRKFQNLKHGKTGVTSCVGGRKCVEIARIFLEVESRSYESDVGKEIG
jgi:hypothetical protein